MEWGGVRYEVSENSYPEIGKNAKLYRIIVAHPGRQQSYRLASALKKANMLLYYITTIYDNQSSMLMKMVKKIISSDNRKRANSRRNPDLNDDVIQYLQFRGLFETLLNRVDKTHEVYRMLQRIDADRFGILVAKKAIKEKVDAVIMYDSNSLTCFKYLKEHAPEIIRIQDVSIVPRPYMKKIYEKEILESGNDNLRTENKYLWNNVQLNRYQKEIDYTQYFLAPSLFVKKGLLECGAIESQIKIVPYGANVKSSIVKTGVNEGRRIEFLFVGQVIYRKGISYLLECMNFFKNSANLTVTGSYNREDWFVHDNLDKNNVKFTGLVTIDKMQQIYENSDVFVIPSFAEGMAQVGIEAMSCGLPIICTFNSGVSDLVEDGINGFVVPCGNLAALKEKMQWFIYNKDKIKIMGEAARKKSEQYTWANYEKRVVNTIKEIYEDHSDRRSRKDG